jgi:hypothetical protein
VLSEQAAASARHLRTMRDDGLLTRLGISYVWEGARLPLHVAVAVALTDLDDLTEQAARGTLIESRRWRRLGDDLEHLYRLATSGESA